MLGKTSKKPCRLSPADGFRIMKHFYAVPKNTREEDALFCGASFVHPKRTVEFGRFFSIVQDKENKEGCN